MGWTPSYPDLDKQIAHAWTWSRDKMPDSLNERRNDHRSVTPKSVLAHGRGFGGCRVEFTNGERQEVRLSPAAIARLARGMAPVSKSHD